jgi:hypothetical protein
VGEVVDIVGIEVGQWHSLAAVERLAQMLREGQACLRKAGRVIASQTLSE